MAFYGNLPTFTHVRTIFVQSTKTGEVGGKELMEQLHAAGLDKNVERFTYQGKPGHFSITAKDEERRVALEESWEEKLTEGTLSFRILPQDKPRDSKQKLSLAGLPEEVKTTTIRAYLAKYVIDPKVTLVTMQGDGWGPIQTGEAEVEHDGLKRILPRRIWVGPGVSAMITKTSQIPWDNQSLTCNKCQMEGHLVWECTNPPKCHKCKTSGHVARDCPKCDICSRFGHEAAKCFFGDSLHKSKHAQRPPLPGPKPIQVPKPAPPVSSPTTPARKETEKGRTNAPRRSRSSSRIAVKKTTESTPRIEDAKGRNKKEGTATGTPKEDEEEMEQMSNTGKRPWDSIESSDESESEAATTKKGKEDSNLSKI